MKSYKKIKKGVGKSEKTMLPKINDIYAAISFDEHGNEGLISSLSMESFPPVEKPLIAITEDDKKEIIQVAKVISNKFDVVIKIFKFTQSEMLAEFKPEKNGKMN